MIRRANNLWNVITRKVRDLASLVVVAFIVLSVLSVAWASINTADYVRVHGSEFPGFRARLPERHAQLYLSADGVRVPVTLAARVDVHGWQDAKQHILDVTVDEAAPADASALAAPSTVAPQAAVADRLKGQRVLTSVAPSAVARLPKSGTVPVRMVVTPRGGTLTLLIDEVYVPSAAVTKSAMSAAVVSPSRAASAAAVSASAANPYVASLSRTSAEPGTDVAIRGTSFGTNAADGWVTCAGARATVRSWSATEVVFTVPGGLSKVGYVGLSVQGRSSNGLLFYPYLQPVLDSISPREGAPGTVVTLSGRHFGDVQQGGWVSFAGSIAQVVSWSDTQIRVVVPRQAMAGWAGVVTRGLSSNGILYAPYGAPLLETVSSQLVSEGERVTVTGRDFGPNPGKIVMSGTQFTATSWASDKVTFVVPKGVRGGYLGVVRDGTFTSNGVYMFVVPRLFSVSNWWGEPGSELVINGVGFGTSPGEYVVTVGREPAQVVSWSDTSVRITVPASAPTGYVGVGTTAACSNGCWFVVESRAHVAAVSPDKAAPGDAVTITGSGFGAAGSGGSVILGGTHMDVVSWSDSLVEARVPAGASSAYVGIVKQNVTSNGVWLTVAP